MAATPRPIPFSDRTRLHLSDTNAPSDSAASVASARARRAAEARHASGRRRLVDPTTCDRDYSADELEFMNAIQEYKRRSGRLFPTWSEVLEVARALGYAKPGGADAAGVDR